MHDDESAVTVADASVDVVERWVDEASIRVASAAGESVDASATDGVTLLAQAATVGPKSSVASDAPSTVGEDLLRQALPPSAPRPVSRPQPAPAPGATLIDTADDDSRWYESTPLLLGAAAVGVLGLAAAAKSPAPAPAPAPTSPDIYAFRVQPMAGEMTGLRIVVVDAAGERMEIDPADVIPVVGSRSGELRFSVTQFGKLAAGERLKIEVHDANGAAPNFDDETNPTVGYDTDLGSTVLSAWISKAPVPSNELADISGTTLPLAITPLSTVAARHIDRLMASHPELFADASRADETIAAIHRSVADLFKDTAGTISTLVLSAQPKPVNADWTSSPDAYGKALAILSMMGTRQESPGIDGVIDYLVTHLQDADPVGSGVALDAAARSLLQTVSDVYFATADISAAIQANLASVSLRRRSNPTSNIGEQVDEAGVIAYTSLTDGLTVAITPAKGARAGDTYTLRFHPEGVTGKAQDYTVVYTLPTDFDPTSTPLPLLHKVPVFLDNVVGLDDAPLVGFAMDAAGNTLLEPGRAATDISRFKLTIEPGPGMKPNFVLPPVDVAVDHAPVAIVSAPATAGATEYHIGETILIKVVLPSKVAWNVSTNGSNDVQTFAPRLKVQVGEQTIEAHLVDPAAANGSNVLVFGYLVTKSSALQGDISVVGDALVASGGSTSIRDVSGGALTSAFSRLVDTTLTATGQGVDALPPVSPTFTLQGDSDSGTAGDRITNVVSVSFDVRGEPLSQVDLTDALGAKVGSVVLDENGRGVLTTRPLANTAAAGTVHVLTATAFDDAGNESPPSAALALNIDNRAPVQPEAALLAGDDTGVDPLDGITRQTTPTVRLVGETGAQIVVFVDANDNGRLDAGETVQGRGVLTRPSSATNVPGLNLADGQGYLDLPLTTPDRPLADGVYKLTALTTDAAGNDSPARALQPLQIVSQPVAAPILAIATAAPDAGYLAVGSKVLITATFERPVHVIVAGDAAAIAPSVTVRLSPTQTVQAALVDGSGSKVLTFEYTVGSTDNSAGLSLDAAALSLGSARLTDVAGNAVDLASAAVPAAVASPLRIDTLAPSVLSLGVLDAGSDTGLIGDGKTGDNTPSFRVIGEGGATVVLFRDPTGAGKLQEGVELGRVVLGEAGAADVQGLLALASGQVLADGSYDGSLKMVQIDAAGNVSTAYQVRGSVENRALVIATNQPGVLTDLEFDAVMDQASVAGAGLAPRDFYTYIATPTFNFKGGDNGNTAILFQDVNKNSVFDPEVDRELGRSTISANFHSVSVSSANALSEGVYDNLRVVQASSTGVLAGEASAVAKAVRINPSAPGPLSISLAAGQSYGNAGQVEFDVISSSYVAGARVVVFEDRNVNGVFDGDDVRLGSEKGDLPVVRRDLPLQLSLAAPTEGSYSHLMAYQLYAGKSGSPSVVAGAPVGGITLDRTGPGLTITSDVFVLEPGMSTQLTLTFDEEPLAGSFNVDLLVRSDDRSHLTMGELSAIVPVQQGGRSVWQATATLSSDAIGVSTFTLDAPAGAYRDRFGNPSQASHFELSGVADATPPVVAITTDVNKVGLAGREAATQALLTFRMSEPVTDFDLADLSVYGGSSIGTIGNLRKVDGDPLAWTAVFTPAASIVAEARISVRNGAVFDQGGNANVASSVRLSVDTAAAPTLAAPDAWGAAGGLRVQEDARLPLRATFASSGATALSVWDTDAASSDSAFERVDLSVGNGRLRVDLAGGVQVNANDSATMTLTGTMAQVNAALATLSYIGASNTHGDDRLVVQAYDRTGKSDRKEWVISVQAVNDAPVVTVPANLASTHVAGSASPLVGIGLDDVDSATVTTVVSVFNGTLSTETVSASVVLTGQGSAELSLTGALADVRAALAGLRYTADGDYHALHPGVTTDTVRVTTTDVEGLVVSRSYTVSVTPRPVVAPTITLSDALSNGGISTSEDIASTPLGAGQITVSDGDPDGSASALVSLTLSVDQGTLSVRHAGNPLSGSVLTLNGNALALTTALATLTYADQPHAHGERTLSLVARDGDGHETVATVALRVASVGDAPVVVLPAAPANLETGKTSALAGIRVSDVDVGPGALSGITVSVQHGALQVTVPTASTSGESVPVVTGLGSNTLTLSGTQTQMQALLDTLTYTPDDGVLPRPTAQVGSDLLTVTASDGDVTTIDPTRTLALSVLVPNKPATGDIAVQGLARVGSNLTIDNTLKDPDGIAGGSVAGMAYTWLRDGAAIGPEATGRTYTVTEADLHHQIAVQVRFNDLRGEATTRTSDVTAAVESDLALGLAQAIRYADNSSTPVSSAQLILSRHGDGYDDYLLDVNRDGLIDASDRTAYISSLSVNHMLTLADGRSARLLSSEEWAVLAASSGVLPADWPMPGVDGAGYWTSTPGNEGTHLVHLGTSSLTTPHVVPDDGGLVNRVAYFNAFRIETVI